MASFTQWISPHKWVSQALLETEFSGFFFKSYPLFSLEKERPIIGILAFIFLRMQHFGGGNKHFIEQFRANNRLWEKRSFGKKDQRRRLLVHSESKIFSAEFQDLSNVSKQDDLTASLTSPFIHKMTSRGLVENEFLMKLLFRFPSIQSPIARKFVDRNYCTSTAS